LSEKPAPPSGVLQQSPVPLLLELPVPQSLLEMQVLLSEQPVAEWAPHFVLPLQEVRLLAPQPVEKFSIDP
jgi:hypothetical protein